MRLELLPVFSINESFLVGLVFMWDFVSFKSQIKINCELIQNKQLRRNIPIFLIIFVNAGGHTHTHTHTHTYIYISGSRLGIKKYKQTAAAAVAK